MCLSKQFTFISKSVAISHWEGVHFYNCTEIVHTDSQASDVGLRVDLSLQSLLPCVFPTQLSSPQWASPGSEGSRSSLRQPWDFRMEFTRKERKGLSFLDRFPSIFGNRVYSFNYSEPGKNPGTPASRYKMLCVNQLSRGLCPAFHLENEKGSVGKYSVEWVNSDIIVWAGALVCVLGTLQRSSV